MKWVPTLIVLAALALLLSLKPPSAVEAAAPAARQTEPHAAALAGGAHAPEVAFTAAAPKSDPAVVHAATAAPPAPRAHDPAVVAAPRVVATPPRNADSVTGYVTAPAGRGLAQMKVALIGPDGKAVATTTSAADGRFTFEHVAPGAYKLTASDPDFLYTTAEPASVTAVQGKAAEANVVLTRGSARISGVVLDANQKPVADQKIDLTAGGATVSVNTDSKGRFMVSGLVDGTWTVVPAGQPRFARTVKTNGSDTPEVSIALVKKSSLTIRVIGTHLHPIALKGGEKAFLRPAGKSDADATKSSPVVNVEKEEEKELARDDRYGKVAFADLDPGTFELDVVDAKGTTSLLSGAAPWAAPMTVTLEAGQERDWPLPIFAATRGLGIEVPTGVIVFMIVALGLLIFATPLLFPPPLAPQRPPMAPASAAPAAPAPPAATATPATATPATASH
jgi:carboxypeptidase family protein